MCVSFLVNRLSIWKYAIVDTVDSNQSFLITVVSVIKLIRLMWHPSLSLSPSACVCEALSLPARSTKFCGLNLSITYNGSNHICNLNDQIKAIRMFLYLPRSQQRTSHNQDFHEEYFQLSVKTANWMSYLLGEKILC